MDFLSDLLASIEQLRAGNVIGVGGVLMFAIRLYRAFPNAPWPSERYAWLVPAVTFFVGFLAAMLTGVFGFGLGWGAAIMAALGVAVNAAGLHNITSAIGAQTTNRIPAASPFRSMASLVLPAPKVIDKK